MGWLIALLALCLIGITRVGARVRFGPDGLSLRLIVGVFSFRLYPAKEKNKERAGKAAERRRRAGAKDTETPSAKASDAQAPSAAPPPKGKRDRLAAIGRFDKKKLIRAAFRAAGRGLRLFRVDVLELRVTVAAAEPHKAAVLYGRVCAAMGAALPLVNRWVNVRRQRVAADLSYARTGMAAEGQVKVTVGVGSMVWFGLWALVTLMRCRLPESKIPKG